MEEVIEIGYIEGFTPFMDCSRCIERMVWLGKDGFIILKEDKIVK